MPLLAVLNSRRRLEELIASGDRPGAVATRTTEVVEAAAVFGIPCVHSDDLSTIEEQIAESAHVHRLGTALAGDEVPAPDDVQRLMWWAIEHPLKCVLAAGYRTRRLIEAGLRLFPDASGIVHDTEGWMQGGVTVLAAEALGLPVVGLSLGPSATMHRPQDIAACPGFSEGVRTAWRGLPTPEDGRRTIAVMHTGEIAQLLRPLMRAGERWLSFAMDAREPWRGVEKTGIRPPVLDARPEDGVLQAPLVEPAWPLAAEFPCQPWEREVAELMFVTYQPWVREEAAWTAAAYPAGRVTTWFGGGDMEPQVRARIAVCRALGIPTLLIQHGAIGDLRLRIHHFADESAMWSRAAVADLRASGCRRPMHVVGWPQAALHLGGGRRPRRTVKVPDGWVVLTTSPADTEGDSYRAGELFLRDALRAIREVAPRRARIVVKIHPAQQADVVLAFCRAQGFPDVTVAEGVDPRGLLPGMRMVLAAPSTAVLSAVHLGVPVVLYHPWPHPTFYGRFREVPVARTYEELLYGLRRKLRSSGTERVAGYARADTDVVRRVLSILRRTTDRGAKLFPSPSPLKSEHSGTDTRSLKEVMGHGT
jgi:hypothetical protein